MKKLSLDKQILSILKKNKIKKSSVHEPFFSKLEINNIIKCIKNNDVASSGRETISFSNKIKTFTKSRYVVLVNSGTSAIHLALRSLNIKENDEVLMPSLNYIAAANSTLYCNAVPHFIEISERTLAIDPNKFENYLRRISIFKKNKLFNKTTKREIKALICLHTFGHPAEIDKIYKICKKFKLYLIEDAAESLGSFYKKKHLGTFGDIGVLSFNANKIITSVGGGAILTSSKIIANKIRKMSNIGKVSHKYKYMYDTLGYNYKLPNLNCAIGLAQLKKINLFLTKKRKLTLKYKTMFSNLNNVTIFEEPLNSKSNYWLQTLILNKRNIKDRESILKTLNKNGYGARPVWQLLHKVNYLKKFPKTNLKISESLSKKIINLPSSSFL